MIAGKGHTTLREEAMDRNIHLSIVLPALIGMLLIVPAAANAATETEGPPRGHMKVSGVVTQGAGALAVKTPNGSTFQLNPNVSRRHGHEPFKEGDEVTVLLDENNTVIDMHPKGQEGTHRFVTGKLVYVGKMKKEIKLATQEGEKVFPMERLEIKTGGIEEGALVTAEVNEAGTVVDLHRAKKDGDTR
jgi:hypothetical protein